MAIGLDLLRSAVFECIALIGVALGATAAFSPPRVQATPSEAAPLAERLRVEDKRGEAPLCVDGEAVRKDYAQAVQAEIDAEFTDARPSERARKGWVTRLRKREALKRAAETQAPVRSTDTRVARSEAVDGSSTIVGPARATDIVDNRRGDIGDDELSDTLAQAIVHECEAA